jgi:apolipoprotein N-acyltransferase
MLTRFLGAVLSAMLLAIAFPLTLPGLPAAWGLALPPSTLPGWDAAGGYGQVAWVAFFALIPLLEVMRSSRGPGEAFGWAYLSGTVWMMLHLSWFSSFGIAAVLLSAFYMGLPVGAFGWIAHLLLRQPRAGQLVWGLPAIWVGMDYLRCFGTWMMPWNYLGYSQSHNLALLQVADLGGVYAVTFLVVLANAALFVLLSPLAPFRQRLGLACAAGAILLGALAYGETRLNLAPASSPTDPHILKLAMVQGGVETLEEWSSSHLMEETLQQYIPPSDAALRDWQRTASAGIGQRYYSTGPWLDPDMLVIWPESVIPRAIDPRHPGNLPYQVRSLIAPHANAALLMGALGKPKNDKRAENGCVLIEPDGQMTWPYSKLRLVPYGEVVPFRGIVRFLKYPWGGYDLCEGRTLKPLKWRGHVFGLMICYDNVWSFIAREQVRQGAQVLVVMTNNSWYKLHSGVRQHCDLDILRAVEYRRPMARCSTTGYSQIVDPCGRILESTNVSAAGKIVRWVKPGHGASVYLMLGDLFAQLCLLAGLWLVLRASFRGKSEGFL